MHRFNALPIQIQVALIASAATLCTLLVRDVIFRIWQQQRLAKETAYSVFRRYADPLELASERLL